MQLSREALWHASKQGLLDLLNTSVFTAKPKTVHFYAPSFMYYKSSYYRSSQFHFPTVSVTGASCALDCKHCGGKVLETMLPAETPEKLLAVAAKIKRHGSAGFLISGGCMPNGTVPLKKFISTIGKIKRKLGLTVLVHTGIIDSDTAVALRDSGVDAALTDIIGSDETVKKVYNLDVTINDYAPSLKALQEAGLNFIPHVIVGLHEGRLKGELDALNIISSVKPSALVIIGFMPIPGTLMAKVKPPQPADMAKVVAIARLMFPRTPLALGCMRPKGKNRAETDMLALKAGVDAIAFPSEEVIKYAEAKRYKFGFSSCCCAQIYMDADFRSPSK